MAAPSSVYKDFKLVDITTVDDRELYVAAYFQNSTPTTGSEWGTGYFNASDIPVGSDDRTTANEKIKSIFKLDAIYPVASGSTTTGAGFIGAISCDAAGNLLGTNAQYHSGSRYSGLIYQSGSAARYRLLNDGGLNRRGEVIINTGINNTESDTANNGFKITLTYKSSFYNYTDSYGVKWRKQGDTVYIPHHLGELKRKGTEVKVGFSVDVDPTDTLQIISGNWYEILAYILNEEGEIVGQMNNILALAIPMTLYKALVRTPEAFQGAMGYPYTYYRDRRLLEGSTFYNYSDSTGPSETGYYIHTRTGNVYHYHYVENGLYQGDSYLSVRSSQEYYGYAATYLEAVQDAVSKGWELEPGRAIYYDETGEKYYTGQESGTYSLDGYYILSDSLDVDGIYENYKLVGGSFVGAHPEA